MIERESLKVTNASADNKFTSILSKIYFFVFVLTNHLVKRQHGSLVAKTAEYLVPRSVSSKDEGSHISLSPV